MEMSIWVEVRVLGVDVAELESDMVGVRRGAGDF